MIHEDCNLHMIVFPVRLEKKAAERPQRVSGPGQQLRLIVRQPS